MKKRLLILIMLLSIMLAVFSTPALASNTLYYDSDINTYSWEVLRLTNQHRMSLGLDPLSTTDDMQMAANQRAAELNIQYNSDHSRPDGSSCFTVLQDYNISYNTAAENIAYGFQTPAAVMNGWLNSSGHRANIEKSSLVHMGVGYNNKYWAQDFVVGRSCSYSDLTLSQTSITGQVGQDLEELLTEADIIVSAECAEHGNSYLPLIAGMCSGYNASTAGSQNVTVTLGSQRTTLVITLGSDTPVQPETPSNPADSGVEGMYKLEFSLPNGNYGYGYSISDDEYTVDSDGNIMVTPGAEIMLLTLDVAGMQLNSMIAYYDGNSQVIINNTPGDTSYTTTGYFTMPSADVVVEYSYITVSPRAVKLSTVGDYASCGTVRLPDITNPLSVVAFTEFRFEAVADTGYVIDTIRYFDNDGNEKEVISGDGRTSITDYLLMYPHDMNISVSFKPDPTVQPETPEESTTPETPTVPNETQQPDVDVIPFADITGHWALEGITYAYQHNLFSGTSAATFEPNALMNRAMVVTVLARYAGVDTNGGSTWYEKGQNWAMNAGVSDGTNMLGSITREQMVTMLYRFAGAPDFSGNLSQFPDASSVSDYAADAMCWAVSNGIISGMDGKLNPQGNATRAEVATIMMRFCENK